MASWQKPPFGTSVSWENLYSLENRYMTPRSWFQFFGKWSNVHWMQCKLVLMKHLQKCININIKLGCKRENWS